MHLHCAMHFMYIMYSVCVKHLPCLDYLLATQFHTTLKWDTQEHIETLIWYTWHTWHSVSAYNWHTTATSSTSHPPFFLQVSLPVAITSRCGHSAVVFGNGASFRVMVLFGGYNYQSGYLSETTLLLLGEYIQYLLVLSPHRLHAVIYHTPLPPFFSIQYFSGSCRCEALGLRKQVIML